MNKKLLYAMLLFLYLASCQNIENSNGPLGQPRSTGTAGLSLQTPTLESGTKSLPTRQSTEIATPSQVDFGGMNLNIAFVSDKQIWYWNQGISTSLSQGNNTSVVRFSSDGNFLAYTTFSVQSSAFFDLWVYSIKDSKSKLLLDADFLKTMVTAGPEFSNAQFTWIPGTHKILLNDEVAGNAYILDAITEEIINLHSVTNPGYAYISPSGETLLIISPSEIFAVDLNKDIKKKLFDYEKIPFGGEGHVPLLPYWSNDSLSFTIAIPSPNLDTPYTLTKIWNISVAGNVKFVAEFSADTNNSHISPDLNWVIYLKSTLPDYGSPVELHLLELESGKDFLVDIGYIRFVSWAPDSLRFSFIEIHNGSREFYLGRLQQEAVDVTKLQPELSFSFWIDGERFFTQKLQIGHVNGLVISITDKKMINSFDFVLMP